MTGIAALARTAGVAAAVRQAAAVTGVDFGYLLAQARIESGLDPAARAATSSARGLFQFTSGTWLETIRRHGAGHGLGWAADALANGTARAGTAARDAILALRDDAQASALMAGEFARDNAEKLETRLGRAAGAADLYLAHFLGAGGATRFLMAMAHTPGQSAASIVPSAARANRNVFFAPDGHARSVSEVYQRFAAKLDSSSAATAVQTAAPRAGAEFADHGRAVAPAFRRTDGAALSAQSARIAYALLADLGG